MTRNKEKRIRYKHTIIKSGDKDSDSNAKSRINELIVIGWTYADWLK